MTHGFSKQNQSPVDTAYRFGEFELHPHDRLLKQSGTPIPIQPKAFDALLCLVRQAQHLVTKQQLTDALWPSVHVSEANLTNLIVSLRKAIGPESIRTVSKHGYRFELKVSGEPGIHRAAYERYLRAKELTAQRSLGSMISARDLYWVCLAEDPTFAPAWAWLGRCCSFLDKFSGDTPTHLELAQAAFHRAFLLDPDLASAHQFYTLVQVDTGQAGAAMSRLLDRLRRHPAEPETYASLVQVLRFRGLLDHSLEAHKRAADLDPTIVTSVPHTLFLDGQYAATIESYGGRAGYYLDTASWVALGDSERAITLLRDRLGTMSLSQLMTALMSSLLALLEDRPEESVRLMQQIDATREPEILAYFARHYARAGDLARAISTFTRAAHLGFVYSPQALRTDPWLAALHDHPDFGTLSNTLEQLIHEARSSFEMQTAGQSVWRIEP